MQETEFYQQILGSYNQLLPTELWSQFWPN
jgi:hypothetical protein